MAHARHRRVTRARLRSKQALAAVGAIALAATLATVTAGARGGEAAPERQTVLKTAALPLAVRDDDRREDVSRAASRQALARGTRVRSARIERAQRAARIERATRKAVAEADTRLWTTDNLNVWTASEGGAQRGVIEAGEKVLVTGRRRDDRTEIVVRREARWVSSGYLSEDKPFGAGAGLSMDPCPSSSVESGLTSAAIYVYRSVCNAFPQITSYGGYAPRGEHSGGEAIDIMVSDVTLGTAIAEFLRSHSSELGLYDIIWRQHIWTPTRGGEGWRYMSSRGSATANHYDHVHVKVY